jgi:hypothetical protein
MQVAQHSSSPHIGQNHHAPISGFGGLDSHRLQKAHQTGFEPANKPAIFHPLFSLSL